MDNIGNWFTEEIGLSEYFCPDCGRQLKKYKQPINVIIHACQHCNKEFIGDFLRGIEYARKKDESNDRE